MLYILDMKLPDGNGISLCRKIRTATENPVLFLSAYEAMKAILSKDSKQAVMTMW